ncbi:MAG: ribosome biogenesis GTP-binding protein YihA/YsxC [Deltaproteobacteria bacterium]|nr:ribosome biogenesis GTP-binding protein YihA/YsxC [Deltaproteobacteria bacterium]
MVVAADVPQVLSATFVAEARVPADLRSLPAVAGFQIAIAGRSNVGKSTLLNHLASRRALARTSKTPGRTRGLIFYDFSLRLSADGLPFALRVVDLPGYGYAKVNKTERESWRSLVETYVNDTQTLKLCLVLVDARRGPEEEEGQLIEWLDSLGIPSRLVATKIDKLTAGERGLLNKTIPGAIGASGLNGEGVDRVWKAVMASKVAPKVRPPKVRDDSV